VTWSLLYISTVQAKENATRSLPNLENGRQPSVNEFWPCITVNQSAMWPLMTIYEVVTGFIGENSQDH